MYSVYCRGTKVKLSGELRTYDTFRLLQVCYLNYRYFFKYWNFFIYICAGKKLFIEKYMVLSKQIMRYSFRWGEHSFLEPPYLVEFFLRLYPRYYSMIYKLFLSKLKRKAGSKRPVYRKEVSRHLLLRRLWANNSIVRSYIGSVAVRSFLTYLVLFNFLSLYRYRVLDWFEDKKIGGERRETYLKKHRWRYRFYKKLRHSMWRGKLLLHMVKYFHEVFYYFLYRFRNIRDYLWYCILNFSRFLGYGGEVTKIKILNSKIGYIKLWNRYQK